MDWLTMYAGCVLAGVVFGGALSAGGSRLYLKLDKEKHWGPIHDTLTLAAITVAAVLVAAAVGAVYGSETEAMANSWRIGAIWGGAGGAQCDEAGFGVGIYESAGQCSSPSRPGEGAAAGIIFGPGIYAD